jgi:starch-binding outer membrane protein, SusD/RagB family
MMKHTHTVLALAALLGAAGCADLKERPVTGVAADYFQTAAGANAAVTGTYAQLRAFYGGEQEVIATMVGTDSWEKGEQLTANAFWNDYTAQLTPSIGNIGGVDALLGRWQAGYTAVNAANTAIKAIGDATGLDATTKNTRLAEARFLRALFYFNLVRTWGAVHLSLEPTIGVVTKASRTPPAEIYANGIIPDLDFAITNLPVKQADLYRATKGAAQTLLAEVYLTRGAQGDFDKARDLATAVIASNTYRLNPSYRALFCAGEGADGACDYAPSQKADPELIFSVQFVGDGGTDAFGNNLHLYWVMWYDNSQYASPTLSRTRAYGRPFRRTRPTKHLLSLWNRTTDSRYDATLQTLWRQPSGDTAIYFPGTATAVKTGQGRKYGENEYTNGLFPTLKKWLDQTRADANTFPGHRDRQLWRLAEVYLLRAEANIRAGRPGDAIADLNVVRARAAKAGTTNTLGATELAAFNASPINFLLDERERELAGEEARWWVLTRMGTDVFLARIRANNPTAAPNVKDFHLLRPIPQTQIDRTEGGAQAFPQNPGY